MSGDLSLRTNWQSLALAFIIWAAHFAIVYATALIIPGSPAEPWIALAACAVALAILVRRWRTPAVRRSGLAGAALGLAIFSIVLQTAPPFFL